MTSTKVRFAQHDALGEIVISDPPMNLFTFALFDELGAAVDRAATAGIRALVIRSDAVHFSAGADVHIFQGLSAGHAEAFVTAGLPALQRLEQLPIPTIAAVHGMCLAAGLEVALACDLIWAADTAQLGLVEAAIGGFPFAGGSQRLAARAGVARAKELVFSAGLYDAATMHAWGVVNRVVPAAELAAKAMAFGRRLAAGPTRAFAATKQLIAVAGEGGIAASDAVMPRLAGEVIASEDLQGGVSAFLSRPQVKAAFGNR